MADWLTKSLQNIVLIISLGGSFIGAVYFLVKDKIRDFMAGRKIKAMEKDVEIGNQLSKHGDDLIDGL